MKPPNSYNGYNRLYTNHASKSSKGDGDIIDKTFQTVIELQEKEYKMKTIKDFYRRYPDAPMPIPKVDSGNLPIKNILEQSFPKISCQNKPSNNPSPQMQCHDNINKISSQETYRKPLIKMQEESGYYGQNQPSSLHSMSLPTTRAYDNQKQNCRLEDRYSRHPKSPRPP